MVIDLILFNLLNSLVGWSATLDSLIVFLASYLAYILVALFIAFVVFSVYSKFEKVELIALAFVSTFVAYFGVTELIRFFYHRPRPFTVLPIQHLITDSQWSFPSGHATFFFALSTIVYLHNKKWGIGFFIATALITVSRVIAGVHYPSDILAGAFIGCLVAYGAHYFYRAIRAK